MNIQVLKALRGEGIKSELEDDQLVVFSPSRKHHFEVVARGRAPWPSELDDLPKPRSRSPRSLLAAPFISESLGQRLTAAGWSWIDSCGNWDIRAPGLQLQRRTTSSPPRTSAPLPASGHGLAMVRLLLQLEPEKISATELAKQSGATQPRASQVLKDLTQRELVEHPSRFEWKVHREEILERFLESYPGPRGTQSYFYSLDAPNEAAVKLFQTLAKDDSAFVSGDVAADLLAPHKRPETLNVYRTNVWKSVPSDWVEATSRNDANIVVVEPRDDSVAAMPRKRNFKGTKIRLADATQVIWDLMNDGGDDRQEAAGILKQWLLSNPSKS